MNFFKTILIFTLLILGHVGGVLLVTNILKDIDSTIILVISDAAFLFIGIIILQNKKGKNDEIK